MRPFFSFFFLLVISLNALAPLMEQLQGKNVHELAELKVDDADDEGKKETEKEESQNIHPSIRRWKHELSTRQATGTAPWAPASNQPTPAAPPAPSSRRTYPTNREQLEAEQRRRRHVVAYTALGFLLLLVIVSIFVPSVVGFILIYIFSCIFVGHMRHRRQR